MTKQKETKKWLNQMKYNVIKVKNSNKENSYKERSLETWKSYLTSYDEDVDFSVKHKSVNLTEHSYNTMMDTVEEIGGDEKPFLTKDMSDEVKDEVMEYINNSIQSWELYRVMWSRGMREPRDVDGVPSNVVKVMMRNLCDNDVDWGDSDYRNLKVERINDEDELSNGVMVGVRYRTIEHQLIHYHINYNSKDGRI